MCWWPRVLVAACARGPSEAGSGFDLGNFLLYPEALSPSLAASPRAHETEDTGVSCHQCHLLLKPLRLTQLWAAVTRGHSPRDSRNRKAPSPGSGGRVSELRVLQVGFLERTRVGWPRATFSLRPGVTERGRETGSSGAPSHEDTTPVGSGSQPHDLTTSRPQMQPSRGPGLAQPVLRAHAGCFPDKSLFERNAIAFDLRPLGAAAGREAGRLGLGSGPAAPRWAFWHFPSGPAQAAVPHSHPPAGRKAAGPGRLPLKALAAHRRW